MDKSKKNILKRPIRIWNIVNIISNQGNQLKLQWDSTMDPVEWLKLKRLTTTTVGKDLEQPNS